MAARAAALLLAASLGLAACAGKQKVKASGEDPGETVDLEQVDPEVLAECPCGNPDWSKLPEGSDEPEPE
jgi:hypothetical protein